MTYEALVEAIKRLITRRSKTDCSDEEQAQINTKLTKLYDIKWVMLQQQAKVVA